MMLKEILQKGRISNVIELTQAYDYLFSSCTNEEENLQIKKMIFDFKVRFISQINQ